MVRILYEMCNGFYTIFLPDTTFFTYICPSKDMLYTRHPSTLSVPVVRDHRGHLAYIQQSGFLPFVPSDVRWAASGASSEAVSGPAGFISLDNPEKLHISPSGERLPAVGNGPFITLRPEAAPQPHILCATSHSLTTSTICRRISAPEVAPGWFGTPPGFPCRRIYYIYDTPAGAVRGGHSHLAEHRLLIALKGHMRVVVTDSMTTLSFQLSSPAEALYIPPGIWREIDSFEAGSVCLALSSTEYDPDDYVRDFSMFKSLKRL